LYYKKFDNLLCCIIFQRAPNFLFYLIWNLYNAEVSPAHTIAWLTAIPVWLYLFAVVVTPWAILGASYVIYNAGVKEKLCELVSPAVGTVAQMAAEPAGVLKQKHDIAE
jgi:hypothetical protein